MNKYEREHIRKIRPYLPECAVLLRKNGAFPLEGPCRIAAAGAGAMKTVKGGTGSGEVNSRYFVSIGQGLTEAGFDVVGEGWAEAYSRCHESAKKAFFNGLKAKAKAEKTNIMTASMGAVMTEPEYEIPVIKGCDAAVYVVSRISGEGNDRLAEKGDFILTDSEVRDILEMDREYEKFMLVINTGGPVDLTPVLSVGNILVLSQLGVETGAVLADILLGNAYPSGKLATTWARYSDYCDVGDFGERDDTLYKEGIYVGYRWFDAAGREPLFPFGFGLGYTEFSLGKAEVSVDGACAEVSVDVTNTGGFRGKEAPQVYVSCPAGRLDREVKSLAGFAKTGELAPGESEKVRIRFDLRDLAAYDGSTESWILEKGGYIVLAGMSSADLKPAAVLELGEDAVVRTVKNLFGSVPFEDWKNTTERKFDTAGLPVIDLDAEALKDGSGEGAIAASGVPSLAGLSDRELAYLNIGAFKPGALVSGVIGDSGFIVPGSAGETTSRLIKKGIRPVSMADGPAGVRISRVYYEDRKGKHGVGSALPESMMEMLPKPARAVLESRNRVRKGVKVTEQYCTAIPIATAVAQTFNIEAAEAFADVVGTEMEMFGVDLWLAPALNIHRNVLCGRNFEYYSEDPLLAGRFAAAMTRGVQKHPGRGVTIKHFAANNQETNRYASNSVVSERALREIYLRGFGLCVREADPMAVMTSYNLINGEHTSESRALTTGILRKEWGFDGIVMTDWVIGGDFLLAKGSKYGVPDPAKVAAAGCSLFMPGGSGDFRKVMAGLKSGTVSRRQLTENARWLLHVISRMDAE